MYRVPLIKSQQNYLNFIINKFQLVITIYSKIRTHNQKNIELNNLSVGSYFGYNSRLTFYRENTKLVCYPHGNAQ